MMVSTGTTARADKFVLAPLAGLRQSGGEVAQMVGEVARGGVAEGLLQFAAAALAAEQ